MVFDDVINCTQNAAKKYMCLGRHSFTDCCYLSQTYSKIPKQLIRDNINMIVVYPQDDLNLKHIFDDHVTSHLTFSQFKKLCHKCWLKKHNFLVSMKEFDANYGMYRSGFSTFIRLKPKRLSEIKKKK